MSAPDPWPLANLGDLPAQAWEDHAGWWQDGFTDGADAEYTEQILPLAATHLAGAVDVLDVGCGEGQVARLASGLAGVRRVVGVDPTWNQLTLAAERGGGVAYGRAGAAALPFADGSFDAVVACLVFEHIEDMDAAVGEVGRVLRPGGRFVFMLNHPLLQTPGSGWIDDQVLEPPEQYWRIGPYLVEDLSMEEVEKDVFIPFIHRPLSRYVNAMAAGGLFLTHMDEPAPPPGFLARAEEYSDAATIPRLLVLRAEKPDADGRLGAGAPHLVPGGPMSEFLVITGLSGAGRSQAADNLEDLGWFVIDNLPPSMIPKVAELATVPGSTIDRIALVVGTGRYHGEVLPALGDLRASVARVRVLFLDAATDVLVRRYASTRRRHPLSEAGASEGPGVAEAIERERRMLEGIKAEADVVVDTTSLNVHQLKARLVELFSPGDPAAGMQTTLLSFGFKHGLPLDVDIVLDLRFLPNPYWVEGLRDMTGLDGPVRDYVLAQDGAGTFLARVSELLELLLPAYVKEGKSYLTIALGCTGGHHRSVVVVEELARRLRADGVHPIVKHRDIAR